jgi:hypothetical protein
MKVRLYAAVAPKESVGKYIYIHTYVLRVSLFKPKVQNVLRNTESCAPLAVRGFYRILQAKLTSACGVIRL